MFVTLRGSAHLVEEHRQEEYGGPLRTEVISVVGVCVGELPVMLNRHFPLCFQLCNLELYRLSVFIMRMGCISYQKEIVHKNWVISTDGSYSRTLTSLK